MVFISYPSLLFDILFDALDISSLNFSTPFFEETAILKKLIFLLYDRLFTKCLKTLGDGS